MTEQTALAVVRQHTPDPALTASDRHRLDLAWAELCAASPHLETLPLSPHQRDALAAIYLDVDAALALDVDIHPAVQAACALHVVEGGE